MKHEESVIIRTVSGRIFSYPHTRSQCLTWYTTGININEYALYVFVNFYRLVSEESRWVGCHCDKNEHSCITYSWGVPLWTTWFVMGADRKINTIAREGRNQTYAWWRFSGTKFGTTPRGMVSLNDKKNDKDYLIN